MKKKTFNLLLLILLAGFSSYANVTGDITATQVGMLDFQEYSNLTEDEMNGTIDVTDKLQQAVNHARNSFKTLFIPSGTYLVSKPIDCIATNQSAHRGHGAVIIVGSQKKRPLIRLQDNAPDFQGTGLPSQNNGPRPVFGLRSVDYPSKNSDWLFYSGMRSIDIDLGWGNPGAIGISWASAQNCFVEEITIRANDGFAGMAGLPGANALTANVDVHGGRYGFYMTRNEDNKTLWAQASVTTIVGCRLYNQKENAIRAYGWGGVTLVGIHIEKKDGTAIWQSGGNNPNGCPLVVIDSRIQFGEAHASNRAIDNSGRSTIGLVNVFTLNANNISYNGTTGSLIPSHALNQWTQVEQYHYVDKNPKRVSTYDMPGMHHVDGVAGSDDVVVLKQQAPPTDLISRHLWPFTPSFEDEGVVLVTTAGGNHRQRIQDAIDNHRMVLLGAGEFNLDGPIVLSDSTVLFGSPGMRSNLNSSSGWPAPTDHVWFIETADSPNANTYLMEVSTNPLRNDYWGSIRWRAGKNSVVRNVAFGRTSGGHERDIKRVYITGSGGGRWYNYNDHKNLWDNPEVSPNHRKVLVEGTTQPLTFYGLNLERGGNFKGVVSEFPMCEIRNASHVRIFGGKSETYQPYAWIADSDNIFLANIQDWGIHNRYGSAQHYIVVKGESSNIEVVNSQWNRPPSHSWKIVNDPWSEDTPHRSMHLGLYRVGKVDFEPFLTQGMVLPVREQTERSGTELRIFPNPSSDGFFLIESVHPIGPVMVFDITGRMVLRKEFDDFSGSFVLRHPGIYLVKMANESRKLIVH